jgi:hypothetical protein
LFVFESKTDVDVTVGVKMEGLQGEGEWRLNMAKGQRVSKSLDRTGDQGRYRFKVKVH